MRYNIGMIVILFEGYRALDTFSDVLFAECVMSLVAYLYNIIQLSMLIGYQSGLACGFSVSCDYTLL